MAREKTANGSAPEEALDLQLKEQGVYAEREYRFLATRKFRFDFAIVAARLAIEIHGGLWIVGRHNRAGGFIRDMEKHNLATLNGWRVLYFEPGAVRSGEALQMIKKVLGTETW